MRTEVKMKRWVCGNEKYYKGDIKEIVIYNTYVTKKGALAEYNNPVRATITVTIETEEK